MNEKQNKYEKKNTTTITNEPESIKIEDIKWYDFNDNVILAVILFGVIFVIAFYLFKWFL